MKNLEQMFDQAAEQERTRVAPFMNHPQAKKLDYQAQCLENIKKALIPLVGEDKDWELTDKARELYPQDEVMRNAYHNYNLAKMAGQLSVWILAEEEIIKELAIIDELAGSNLAAISREIVDLAREEVGIKEIK